MAESQNCFINKCEIFIWEVSNPRNYYTMSLFLNCAGCSTNSPFVIAKCYLIGLCNNEDWNVLWVEITEPVASSLAGELAACMTKTSTAASQVNILYISILCKNT